MNLPEVTVEASLRARLAQGHPWVYRNHVRGGDRLPSGTWVQVRCGNLLAYGLWDAQSAIALRIFSLASCPDAAWVADRVWDAWTLRAPLREQSATTAYRWIYGEGDGLPGLVADRYGDYVVLQTYAESVQTLVPLVVSALLTCDRDLRGIVLRERVTEEGTDEPSSVPDHPHRVRLLWGEMPPDELVVQEHGLFLSANLLRGQKTGLFLDHRENRRLVESLASGREVLNCFAYTGAFSLYALRGGAARVVSVDSGHGLAQATDANLALNGMAAANHRFVTEDCFALLDRYAKTRQLFQVLILDPPSFARQKSSSHAASRAYTRLNSLALRCLEPGGLLVSASCTSQMSPEHFRSMLAEAATQTRTRLQILHETGQPLDHPVPAGFPEGRYLKFVVARALPVS
ncbi:class I SAM-dependent rRNA methyltransferase [Candidatus Chloroploca asiatica]|uniref:SAM-dependent methyltransferase n=1 Tax=Candidatus Chloroploca asiatica TaxID=1506545 RepID=A0A2H3KLT4_9CHLR|nr:class I SAM-dependent rRNA methyltransferase [Candidatus Chloroploca asiatica]PDV99047.1 SAM-dependent methyltransferase [Candidatus Chloroploca asiatica]